MPMSNPNLPRKRIKNLSPEGSKKPSGKSKILRIIAGLVFGGLLLFWIVSAFITPSTFLSEKPLSEALSLVKENKVQKIEVQGEMVYFTLKDGTEFAARKEAQQSFYEVLRDSNIEPDSVKAIIEIKDPSPAGLWLDLLVNIIPVILMAGLFFWIFKQARGAGTDILQIGKSTAREYDKDGDKKVTFDDAAGVEEAKKELREIVDFLKNQEKYRKLGARIPKGVLLVGPAGTGKTLLARAVANEADVPFFNMAGSEFMEMLVGVGPSRVRDLFANAKKNAPALIFIDELESIGRRRGGVGFGGGHDEREQTLNQILVEMDGFAPNTNVIVLGASNRPELLDPALVRPGRFDRRIVLDLPDIQGREGIIKIHMRGKPFADGVDINKIARRTVGFSGADIENMLNEAAIMAARQERAAISMEDIEEAATKVKLGPEKKRLQSEEDKKMTAYHEGGHALVGSSLPNMDPVHRVSIVSRGLALGFTMIPPLKDRYNETKTRLVEQITALLGGRAAEQLVFDEMTVGAASDLKKASKIARKMVVEYGMSNLGPFSSGSAPDEEDAWPYRFNPSPDYSEEMANKVDAEIKRILDDCLERAKQILVEKRDILDKIADQLVEQETLEEEEFKSLVSNNSNEL